MLILPLFNKFEPLPDGELKDAIDDYAAKMEARLAASKEYLPAVLAAFEASGAVKVVKVDGTQPALGVLQAIETGLKAVQDLSLCGIGPDQTNFQTTLSVYDGGAPTMVPQSPELRCRPKATFQGRP